MTGKAGRDVAVTDVSALFSAVCFPLEEIKRLRNH